MYSMKLLVSSILVAALIVSPITSANWEFDRGNVNRTGASSEIIIPPLMVSKDDTTGKDFELSLGGENEEVTNCAPVISDNVLVIGTHSGYIYGIHAKNFKRLWQDKTDSEEEVYRYSACIEDEKVYIGNRLGELSCRDLISGKVIWEEKFDGWITTSPLITDGDKLLFGTNEGYVYQVNKKNGKLFSNGKSEQLIGPVYGLACTGEDDNRVFVGCGGDVRKENSRNLYCLNTINLQKQKWNTPKDAGGAIHSNPVVYEDKLYLISSKLDGEETERKKYHNYLACFGIDDENDGHRYWISDPYENELWASPAVHNNMVVTRWSDSFIRVFDVDGGGDPESSLNMWVHGSPMISGDYAYFSDKDSNLIVINYMTGEQSQKLRLCSQKSNEKIYIDASGNSPIIANGYVYFVNTLGQLYKLEAAPKGKLTINKTEIETTTIDQFEYELIVENNRTKNEVSHTNLVCQLEWEIGGEKYDSRLLEIPPEGKEVVKIKGTGGQFEKCGSYEIPINFKINNAHEFEVIWGDKTSEKWVKPDEFEKDENLINDPLYERNLSLNLVDPTPCLETVETIDLGDIWDDEISQTVFGVNVKNPCHGKLEFEVFKDGQITLIGETEYTVEAEEEMDLRFGLSKEKIADSGELEFQIILKPKIIDEKTITVKMNIKPSKSEVVVQIGSTKAMVNGKESTLDAAPYITKGTTMVPLRFVSEGLGFEQPEWVAELRTIIINLGGGRYLRLRIDNQIAFIEEPDGSLTQKELAVAPEIKNGRTFVPLRFIGETIGAQVDWNGETKEVTLTRILKP